MAQLPQIKKGYLRGVRGVVVTGLNSDGSMPVTPTKYGIKTTREITFDAQVIEGPAGELRGGDKLLAYVKDPDTIVAVNLTIRDARFDAQALQVIAGGTLIEVPEGTDTRIVGWEAPNIQAQQTPPVFQAEVYVESFSQQGVSEGFARYTFYMCRGRPGGITHTGGEWAAHEIIVYCQENPTKATSGVYKKEFVDTLPAELA